RIEADPLRRVRHRPEPPGPRRPRGLGAERRGGARAREHEREATMAKRVDIRGAVPVLAMPFDEDGAIDEDSLRREIDFCLEAGSQAICFGVASESNQLTDEERARVWRLAGRHPNGAVALVRAPPHPSREGTIALTRLARDCGADC